MVNFFSADFSLHLRRAESEDLDTGTTVYDSVVITTELLVMVRGV